MPATRWGAGRTSRKHGLQGWTGGLRGRRRRGLHSRRTLHHLFLSPFSNHAKAGTHTPGRAYGAPVKAEGFFTLSFVVGAAGAAPVYLFIRHDGMQPGSYGPLEKQMGCLEGEKNERLRSHAFLRHEQVQKCKNRMWYCRSQCSKAKTAAPSSFPSHRATAHSTYAALLCTEA